MKNSKLLFTALGVTAIVGSALTMTASVRLNTWCARPISQGQGVCTLTDFRATEIATGTPNYYAYIKTGTTCPSLCTQQRRLSPE